MPMNNRLLRPIARAVSAAAAYFRLLTIGGNNITTLSGDKLRSLQDA